MKIAILGLGYVGLRLSLQFARSGVAVVELADGSPCIVDTRNTLAGSKTKTGQDWKA